MTIYRRSNGPTHRGVQAAILADEPSPSARRGANRRPHTLVLCASGVRHGRPSTARARGFRLPGLPPATTEAPAAKETPVPEEASMTEATPGIGGCSSCGHTHSRYPGHTQDLGSH